MNWQQLSFNAKSFRSREQRRRRGKSRFASVAASRSGTEFKWMLYAVNVIPTAAA